MTNINDEFEELFEDGSEADDSLSSVDIDEGDITALAHLYKGNSEGFKSLAEGYSAYSFETMQNRSLPDVRDGLKPVQRRIIYAMYLNKKKFSQENGSLELVGAVYPMHPHGDSSIYSAAVRMTDKNGSFMVPLLSGGGNVGTVVQPGKEAAPRYSKMWAHKNDYDFLRDMDGAFWKPAEADESKMEPAYLPVRYPFVLCNPAMGIAVGMNTRIPAYNFFDVVNLTIKFLKGEDITHEVLCPDFPTGGFVLKNDEEFLKILNLGHGQVRIRARVEISPKGDDIEVLEIPYGKTRENIIEEINHIINPPKDVDAQPIPGLKAVNNYTQYKSNNISITCARGTAETVLLHLYKRGILQTNFAARLNVVNGNQPIIGGIPEILEAWYNARERVMAKVFHNEIEGYKQSYIQYSYFLRLVMNEEWKDEYLRRITKVSTASADEYLRGIFDDIPEDVVKWIHDRRAAEFNKGGKYKDALDNTKSALEEAKYNSEHIKEYVIKDLESLKQEHAGEFPRISELTTKDYKFVKASDIKGDDDEEVEEAPAWFTVTKEGLLYKTRDPLAVSGVVFQECISGSSTLIGFDIYGRILRFFGEQVPVSNSAVNLAEYFDVPAEYRVATPQHPAWGIPYMTELDGKKRYVLYTNGKLSIMDTAKYANKGARRRVVNNGMPADVYENLFEIIHEDDMPETIIAVDNGKSRCRVGWFSTEDIRDTASAKAQERVLGGAANLYAWYGATDEELSELFGGEENEYQDRVKGTSDEEMLEKVAGACDYGSFVRDEFEAA